MPDKNDKQRIYWLIDSYLSNTIDDKTFCYEFYYSYSLELDYNTPSEVEKISFSELNKVVSRYSEYEEDHKLDSRAFSTKQELDQKIKETKERLSGN